MPVGHGLTVACAELAATSAQQRSAPHRTPLSVMSDASSIEMLESALRRAQMKSLKLAEELETRKRIHKLESSLKEQSLRTQQITRDILSQKESMHKGS
jgi:hypothetical protein